MVGDDDDDDGDDDFDEYKHLYHFSFHSNDSFQLSYQYEITRTPMISCNQPWAFLRPCFLGMGPLDVHRTLYVPYLDVLTKYMGYNPNVSHL